MSSVCLAVRIKQLGSHWTDCDGNLYFGILTCISLWRRLFRVTLEISRTVINLAYSRVPRYREVTAGTLTATDTYALRMHM
jgi:hypothetical protein